MDSRGRRRWRSKLIGPTLAECLDGRDNSLNLVRIAAASAVLISHAFILTSGHEASEPLRSTTGLSLGQYSVAVFFGISGLLISRSFDRRISIWHFTAARFLRLWPGLAVVSALTAFVLGPLFSSVPITRYFAAIEVWTYLPRALTLYLHPVDLPGLFTTNPLPRVTNGSLWSLFYEVTCYCAVVAAGYLGLLRRKCGFLVLFVAAVLAHGWSIFAHPASGFAYRLDSLGFVAFPFVLGMAAYVWRARLTLGPALFAALCLGAAVLSKTPFFSSAIMMAAVYTALWAGFCSNGPHLAYNRLGDYSYGVYLVGSPVQQTLVQLHPTMSALANIALAWPLTLLLGYASWHLIEQRSLALARPAGDWLCRTFDRPST